MRLFVSFLLLMASLGAASAETLVTSLSSHRVLINSNYTGTSIAVFGAIERDAQTISRGTGYDAAVTVRGPPQYLVVREKERLGPLWLNREQQKFPQTPAFLERSDIAADQPRSPASSCASARRSACRRSSTRPISPMTGMAPTSLSAKPCCV